jgi:tetratricopeptide (TPR) repeat protein
MSTTVAWSEDPSPAGESLPAIPGYELIRVLGRGGMGQVYLGRDSRLGRDVAIKTLFAGADPTLIERFRAEVTAVAAIRHPNVLPVHHAGEVGGRPYLVMEYVPGGTLAQALAGKPMPARDAARLLEPIARAVHHCHERGIIHRDLKPGNILLQSDERKVMSDESQDSTLITLRSSLRPKVADFGLAKRFDSEGGLTRTGDVLGTPAYMAPEQASGVVTQLGPAVDVYALGAILYEMLTGRPPFQSPDPVNTMMMVLSMDPIPPRRLLPKLPRDLDTICLKCLEKSPKKRYPSAAALADDLHRFLDGRPIVARPAQIWETTAKWARRRPAQAALAAVSLLLVAGLAVGAVLVQRKNSDLREANHALEVSRAETARQLQIALAAVHQMLIRLADDLATVPRASEARQKVLADAEGFCQAVIRRNAADPGGREFVAMARLRLGEVYAAQGRMTESANAYHTALDGYFSLTAEAPSAPEYRAQLVAVHNQIGILHDRQGEPAAARAEYEAALAESEQLAGDPDAARLVGRVRNNLAVILVRTGELDRAETEHRRNLTERKRTVEQNPADAEAAADLATTRLNLAALLTRREQWTDALDELFEAERLFVGLQHPRPADRAALGQTRLNIGTIAERLKRLDEDRRAVAAAAETLAALSADFPIPEYRHLSAVAKMRLARRVGLDGNGDRADQYLRAALDLLTGLVKEFPDRTEYAQQLDLCRQLLGGPPSKK